VVGSPWEGVGGAYEGEVVKPVIVTVLGCPFFRIPYTIPLGF
jgi:hypothetical protein